MLVWPRVVLLTDASSTSQCNRTPINLRSEMVRRPDLLVDETRLYWTSFGHSQNHTIGDRRFVPPNQTPPAPHFEESTKP
jgi:hypothetical protein